MKNDEAVNIEEEIKLIASYYEYVEKTSTEIYIKDYIDRKDVSSFGYMFWWDAEAQTCGIEYQNTPGGNEHDNPCVTALDFMSYISDNT